MRVLLTGVTGLLGGHILEELINRKIEVKCLFRNSLPNHLKKYTKVDFIEGDITNYASLENAIIDCTAVIHAAADTSMLPTFSKKRIEVNVNGTASLIKLALKKNIERFIYVGTANIFESGSMEDPGDETTLNSDSKGIPQYIRTKNVAHNLIKKAIKEDNLKAIITAPCYMLGENDFKPSSGKMVQTIIDGKLAFSSSGGKNIVYTKDVAIAICNSLNMGRIGETYILGNQNISYRDLFDKIAHYASKKPPKFNVPNFPIKFFGFLGNCKEVLFRKTPLFNLHLAIAATKTNYFKVDKAIKELNLPQTPIDTTIKNTVDWFLEQEKLKN